MLSTLDLAPEQRQEVIGDVIRTQGRIEATLTALERLAQRRLTTVDDFVPFDVAELLDRAAHRRCAGVPGIGGVVGSLTRGAHDRAAGGFAIGDRQCDRQRCEHNGATEVRLSVSSSAEGVQISVDDNGSGVPEEERKSVFERFPEDRRRRGRGSGLGLPLLRNKPGCTVAQRVWRPVNGRCAAGATAGRA